MKKQIFKCVCCSDLHIRRRKPKNRIDNFYLSQKRKIAWLFKVVREEQATLLIGGDVFDTPTQSYDVVRDYVELLIKYNIQLFAIYGQHDLRYHSYNTKNNTPLALLMTAIKTMQLDGESKIINDSINIVGGHWEQNIPDPIPDKFNILLTHQMVTKSGGLWPGHNDYTEGHTLLKKTGYNLIVSGDNHQSFISTHKKQLLINSGSIVRLKKDQIDYRPRIAIVSIFDDYSIEFKWEYVPIKDGSIVFAEERDSDDIEEFAGIQEFISSLGEYENTKPDYVNDLSKAATSTKDTDLIETIDTIIVKAGQKD